MIEFQNIFQKSKIKPISLEKLTNIEPRENGTTFKQNALIKARFASKLISFAYPTISDDSGICIENLENKPGVYSSRWASKNNYSLAFKKIVKNLKSKGINVNGQYAKFVCIIALIDQNKEEFVYEGVLKGSLIFPPRGSLGFGYDPIFIPEKSNKTLAEMGSDFKNLISHRKKAINKLLENKLFKNFRIE